MIKKIIKKYYLKYKKGIIINLKSNINSGVINKTINSEFPCKVIDSYCSFKYVNEGCKITETRCYGKVSLGRFVSINGPGTVINPIKEEIYIGSFSSIGQNVCIVDFNHSFERITSCFINAKIFKKPVASEVVTKGPVIIGEDVWIGSNTLITAGVKIGRGAVIGGGSVVTRDIPSYSIAYGNPAKVLSMRFDEKIIEYLEKLKWWDWDIKKIIQNKKIFSLNIRDILVDHIDDIII